MTASPDRMGARTLSDPAAAKPEPLRHMLAGAWSRRISEHRPVYLVVGDGILGLPARFHHT
jgi:toxin YoeB